MSRLYTIESEIIDQGFVELSLNEFKTKRIFWIYNNSSDCVRGRHRHQKSTHILHCVVGSCKVMVNNGLYKTNFFLEKYNQFLFLEPTDWREMYEFSEDCILMCFSNELYDVKDYIYQPFISSPILNQEPVCV